MTAIFERVKSALDTLAPIPYAQGKLRSPNSAALPDCYLVYSVVSGAAGAHYDDQETARNYRVQVSILKRGGLVGLPDVKTAMTTAGFTIGPERELDTDAQSGHYHYAIDFYYYEEILP